MPFQKGNNLSNGRPKGSANKVNDQLREMVRELIESVGLDKLKKDIKELKAKERIDAMTSLLEFVLPKLNRTTISGDKENPLTIQDARRELIEKLTPPEKELPAN